MTSIERVYALTEAVRYVVVNGIDGALVECGVWKGGSMMAVALTLKQLGAGDRDLFLFDTFEGMPPSSDVDRSFRGELAVDLLEKATSYEDWIWAYCPENHVRQVIETTGYDMARVHFVRGRVEETIPDSAPERIALLRLDTDWYESTRHEMIHLFPRIVVPGVLIVDDYGHWQGARRAVDEYIEQFATPLLLNRVDYTARIAVKTCA
jgi:hypothetical protein